jgi:uncharacterized protein YggE
MDNTLGDHRMMYRIALASLALVLATTLLDAQSVDQRRTISVTGEATMDVQPDNAEIRIGVVTEGMDITKIKADNDRRVRAIFDALQRIGIAKKDIATTRLQISPVYEYTSGRRNLVKYQMQNAVTITLTKLDNVEAVVNEAVASGGNTLDQLTFLRSNSEQLRDSLQIEAARNARTRADALAGALGAKVLRPVSISGNTHDNGGNFIVRGARSRNDDAMQSTPVSGGTLDLSATVDVIFEIE